MAVLAGGVAAVGSTTSAEDGYPYPTTTTTIYPTTTTVAPTTTTIYPTTTTSTTTTTTTTTVPSTPEGCTPGYWKNHLDSWVGTGYSPSQLTGTVFSEANLYGLGTRTLLQSLQGGCDSDLQGAARILLRAGVAALLNAASPGVDYPLTTNQVINRVNAALASGDRDVILSLAARLDRLNNAGCPLN